MADWTFAKIFVIWHINDDFHTHYYIFFNLNKTDTYMYRADLHEHDRGVAMGVYIAYIYSPKISPSQLWGNNDFRTIIEHEY